MALSLAGLALLSGLAFAQEAPTDTGMADPATEQLVPVKVVPVAPQPPDLPVAPAPAAADALPAAADALPAALERVAALERRLAELEDGMAGSAQDGPPSVSQRGGLIIEIDRIVQDAVGLGGPVEVAGTVRGTAVGVGSDVLVRHGGRVEGDAVSLGGEVLVEEGGAVAGRSFQLGAEEGAEVLLALPTGTDLGSIARALGRRLALLLAFVAAGTLTLSLWPRQIDEISARLSDRPFWYGMAGAVLTVGLGAGAVVLSLTVIGLPLALLFLVVLALAWLIGLVSICRTTGRRMAFARNSGDTGAWLAGAAVFALLGLVPVLGTVVAIVIGLPAAGAAVVAGLSGQEHQRSW